MIASHIAGTAIGNLTGGMGINIPNIQTLAVLVPATLNLVGCCGGAPGEILAKSHRNNSLSVDVTIISTNNCRVKYSAGN